MNNFFKLTKKERDEHVTKHSKTIFDDVIINDLYQLPTAVARLIMMPNIAKLDMPTPINWDSEKWIHMCSKSYEERLIIAASLLAAEYDRIQIIKKRSNDKQTKN